MNLKSIKCLLRYKFLTAVTFISALQMTTVTTGSYALPSYNQAAPAKSTDAFDLINDAKTEPEFVSNVGSKIGPYCTASVAEGASFYVVNSNYAQLSEQQSNSIHSISESIQKLNLELLDAKRQTLESTHVYGHLSKMLPDWQFRLRTAKKKIEVLVENWPKTMGGQIKSVIAVYIETVEHLLAVQAYTDPHSLALTNFRNQYGLQLTSKSFLKLFPVTEPLLPNTEVSDVTLKSKGLRVLLHLNSNLIYTGILTGIAKSPKSKNAYLDSARCSLGRAILVKHEFHKSFADEPQLLSADPNLPLCLKSNIKEIQHLAKLESAKIIESQAREKFSQILPTTNYSDEHKIRSLISGVLPHLYFLFGFPENLSVISAESQIPAEAQMSTDELAKIQAYTETEIHKFKEENGALAAVMGLWSEPELLALIKKAKSDCEINQIPAEDFGRLVKLEEYFFSFNFADHLRQTRIPLTNLSPKQLKDFLIDFIIDHAHQSVRSAFVVFAKYYIDTKRAPEAEEILVTITDQLDEAINTVMKRRLEQSDLEKLAVKIQEKISSNLEEAKSLTFKNYVTLLEEKSSLVVEQMDPTLIQNENLKYDTGAILRTLSPMAHALSPAASESYMQLQGATSFAEQKALWPEIKARLEARAAKLGVTCEVGFKAMFKNKITSFRDGHTALAAGMAQSDCYILNYYYSILSLDRSEAPTHMSQAGIFLNDGVSRESRSYIKKFFSKWGEDPYTNFFNEYRKQLVAEILAEYRILELSQDADDTTLTGPRLYTYLKKNAGSDLNHQAVKKAIKASLISLNKNFQMIAEAKSAEDLKPIILHSNVISSLFGAGMVNELNKLFDANTAYDLHQSDAHLADILSHMPGGIYRDLLHQHDKLKRDMEIKQGLYKEIWDEIRTDQSLLTLIGISGWALKYSFTLLPRITGLPLIASGLGHLGNKTSFLLSGQLTQSIWTFGALATYGQIHKSEYTNTLEHMQDMLASDALSLSEFKDPIPMISYSDYLSQKTYFQSLYKQANSDAKLAAFFVAFPRLVSSATKISFPYIERLRMTKYSNFRNFSPGRQAFHEFRLKIKFRHRQIVHRSLLKKLNNPMDMSVANLKLGRDLALQNAKSVGEKRAIEQAYEKLIYVYGSDLIYIAQYPDMMASYARALIGKNGRADQLHGYITEFNRIWKLRGEQFLWQ